MTRWSASDLARESGVSLSTIHRAEAAITTAVNNGSLSPEEAGNLVRVLEGHAKAIETYDFAVRLDRLEAQLKGSS